MATIPGISEFVEIFLDLLLQSEAIVNNFDVRGLTGTVEGPQIVIEWTPPLSPTLVSEIRLLRKLGGPPNTPTDGVTIFSAANPNIAQTIHFVDFEVEPCVCYFYRMFSQRAADGIWFAGEFDDDFSASPAFHGEYVFNEQLPPLYRKADQRLGAADPRQLALRKIQDARPGFFDYVNLTEPADGSGKPRGQLERFLRVYGQMYDVVKSHIDCFPALIDVDRTCSRFLPSLATKIGLDLNREFDVIKQREEIKSFVPSLRIKGSDLSIESRLLSITGSSTEVKWWQENLLVSNRIERVSADLDDVAALAEVGCPNDPLYYSLGVQPTGRINPTTISPFVTWDQKTPLTKAVIDKIGRTLTDVTPAALRTELIVKDKVQESYDASNTMVENSSDATNP